MVYKLKITMETFSLQNKKGPLGPSTILAKMQLCLSNPLLHCGSQVCLQCNYASLILFYIAVLKFAYMSFRLFTLLFINHEFFTLRWNDSTWFFHLRLVGDLVLPAPLDHPFIHLSQKAYKKSWMIGRLTRSFCSF